MQKTLKRDMDSTEKRDRRFLECLRDFHRSRGEEWANGISHLVGVIFSIVALTMMCVFAAQQRSAIYVTSCAIFGTTLILLYTASMLYHSLSNFKAKKLFQLFDHCSIYLLIAGSYTPYSLLGMKPSMGWCILGIEWGLALIGILLETLLSRRKADIISLPIFIVMGWLIVVNMGDVFHTLNMPAFATLCAGGLSYTLGVLFFMMDHVPYMHFVWHLFVLGGSVCHWVSITFFIV